MMSSARIKRGIKKVINRWTQIYVWYTKANLEFQKDECASLLVTILPLFKKKDNHFKLPNLRASFF